MTNAGGVALGHLPADCRLTDRRHRPRRPEPPVGARDIGEDAEVRTQEGLISSLFRAIVRADGHMLVIHAGEKPYIVTSDRRIDLGSREMPSAVIDTLIVQLLPKETLALLDEPGGIRSERPSLKGFPNERFTVVVDRFDHDVRVAIRRVRVLTDRWTPPSANRLQQDPKRAA